MRNSQWQAAVEDMRAAGLNPALAYGQGPNAAPGGSTAQVQDALSPAVSSAMQMKRLTADVNNIRAQTEKVKADKRASEAIADREQARNFAYGLQKTEGGRLLIEQDPGKWPLMRQEIEANVRRIQAQARREGLTGDVMAPMADLAGNMGQWLPILGLASQFTPRGIGNLFKRGGKAAAPIKTRLRYIPRPRPKIGFGRR